MSTISPLAHVDPDAKIGNDVTIYPFAFVSKNTVIGDGCVIYPYASILNGSRIGNRVKIYNGAIIAAEPQDFRWKGEMSTCHIGDETIVREHTIVNRGMTADGATRIGNKCFIMAESHVMHDVEINDMSIVGNGAQVAPYVHIDSYTILSSNAMVHAGAHLGKWVMIKGGCRISGNVPPYTVMAHNPVAYNGVNAIIMRATKLVDDSMIDEAAKCYRIIYESQTSIFNAIKRIQQDVLPGEARDEIIKFIRKHDYNIVALPVTLQK